MGAGVRGGVWRRTLSQKVVGARSGVLYDLLRERTSLTYGTISAPVIAALMERGQEALARPLASLDDVQFVPSRAGMSDGGLRS